MNVKELRRLSEEQASKSVRIYNPDTEDFTVTFNDSSGAKEYTIHALEMEEFPFHVAKHIQKHLADKLLFKRGIRTSSQADLKKIKEEIEVIIE